MVAYVISQLTTLFTYTFTHLFQVHSNQPTMMRTTTVFILCAMVALATAGTTKGK